MAVAHPTIEGFPFPYEEACFHGGGQAREFPFFRVRLVNKDNLLTSCRASEAMSIVLLATPASTDDNSGQGRSFLFLCALGPSCTCLRVLSFLHTSRGYL